VEVTANGNGVIVCQGGRFGGLSFYLNNGKPAFTYNYLGLESMHVMATEALPAGKYQLVYNFQYDGVGAGKGGKATIYVNGQKVAENTFTKTQPGIFSVDDMADIGVDEGTPVTNYFASSKFNGKIMNVKIEVKK
jgi:arylsulfatase